MSISIDEVRHVAKLARLQLDEAEILALQGELNVLLGHFVDIQGLGPATSRRPSAGVALQNVWSEDLVSEPMGRDEVMMNAPVSKAGLFVVPTIIED